MKIPKKIDNHIELRAENYRRTRAMRTHPTQVPAFIAGAHEGFELGYKHALAKSKKQVRDDKDPDTIIKEDRP